MKIKELFDPNSSIDRTIEKVITYGASQEERLKAEISEYIVTESIENQFQKLLTRMQDAMNHSGGDVAYEIGVWVSGFYGSGKSSLTKYLGLAFDDSVKIDGRLFKEYLSDRFQKATTKALLTSVTNRFSAAVVLLDLASEQVAGATMEEVSTVLYYKVLQWAGYSRNLKIAAFERKVKKEGRYQEFLDHFKEITSESWANYRNDPLTSESTIPVIAHKMYPKLFSAEYSFSTDSSSIIHFENDRVEEMLSIAREATGKDYVIFVIDEVGQYVGARPNLILNLDGLAKNLKDIGQGKAWIVGTAQQTLTEDDAKASLNSAELFKLNARFPIQIDLEANDIKEICYSRLLRKSPQGESILAKAFDSHGQMLRQNTSLVEAKFFDSSSPENKLSKENFIKYYPFLPSHFAILLHLLGAMAKSTGGIGLRSAIKVIQEIMVESPGSTQIPNIQKDVGWLATTVTLYNSLENDIRRAFSTLHQAVAKVKMLDPDNSLQIDIAKTVCILQILDNIPRTPQNIASLMHPGISNPPNLDNVKQAIEDLTKEPSIPFGEEDNQYKFFSEKLNDIEKEKSTIVIRSLEINRIRSEALKEVYNPLPSVSLFTTLAVQTGLKTMASGGVVTSLAGDRNPIQTIIDFSEPLEYSTALTQVVEESRQRSHQTSIFLLGQKAQEMDELANEVYRCREIANKYKNDPESEIRKYCSSQSERANKLILELTCLLKASLTKGSFVFRGITTAVDTLGSDLIEASKKNLSEVAKQVFEKYIEAPVRVDTDLAEKFLKMGNLNSITTSLDPLSFVQTQAGQPSIQPNHRSIRSICDTIEKQGAMDGKRLTDIFTDPPYGWSPDTFRYILAAMLLAGLIKLKVAGKEISVNGQLAIDALKSNNSFKTVGVSLRDNSPSTEILARAAERLTELSGEAIIPLEDVISKATSKLFPGLQYDLSPLTEKIRTLALSGVDRLEGLSQDIKDVLSTDASDASVRLGVEDSSLFVNLMWAIQLKQKFDQGLEGTLRELQNHRQAISALPDSGTPGVLRGEFFEVLESLDDKIKSIEFFRYTVDYNTSLTELKTKVRYAVARLANEQKDRIKACEGELSRIPEWKELTAEEQNALLSDLESLACPATEDLKGLRTLVNQEYTIQTNLEDIKIRVQKMGQDRLQDKLRTEQEEAKKLTGQNRIQRKLTSKKKITSLTDLDQLILDLSKIRSELQYAHEFELNLDWKEITQDEL